MTREEWDAQEEIDVEALEFRAQSYEDGMFRQLVNRLKEELPRPKGEEREYWQLGDDLKSTLYLLLFPAVLDDQQKYHTAYAAFAEVTGAEPILKRQLLKVKRASYESVGKEWNDTPTA